MNSVETNVKYHNFAQLNSLLSQFSRIASLYSVRLAYKMLRTAARNAEKMQVEPT